MEDIIIVGGGAAGLAAAITAAGRGCRVTVAERLDRVGKKLLSTGNGRGNLGSEHIAPGDYVTGAPEVLEALLRDMPPEKTTDFFARLGLLFTREEGRIYPQCMQASMLLDVLLLALRQRDVRVECGAHIRSVRGEKGGFFLETEDGRRLEGKKLILAAGGRAAPKLGSDGSGFSLARSLGHTVTPLSPGLTALCCDMKHAPGLKGIRARCRVGLHNWDLCVEETEGEVQFTDYGLSGIPAMQLSNHLPRAGKGAWAEVDLFPQWNAGKMLAGLRRRREIWGEEPLENFLLGTVHKRLAFCVLKNAGLAPLSRKCSTLADAELERLCRGLKAWRFPITGVRGWDEAQVTCGGVPLDEIEPATLESRKTPGLYLAGEVLDAAGTCGGYNLHWAFCTGICAGESAGSAVR